MSYSRIVTRRKTESYEMRKPYRSSHNRCSIVISVLKNFRKFTGKHLCQSLFLIKLQVCRSFLQNTFGQILLTLVKSQIWVETKPRAQSFFQKLSFAIAAKKTCKGTYQAYLLPSGFTEFLYFVLNILSGIVEAAT